MAGTLYLVPTPIGNLGDISRRMAETLETVDFIAAEDTRITRKLLNHLGLRKPLVTYHRHNTEAGGQAVLNRLLAGESCALVTDAGTPAISDPGEELVALCAAHGVPMRTGDRPGGFRTPHRTLYLRGLFGHEQKKPPRPPGRAPRGDADHDLL